jgi:type IV pilus assembly protein PilM
VHGLKADCIDAERTTTIKRSWRAKLAKRVSVGLDIGSSAVRAAEVTGEGDQRRVTRFAQVGLPAGAVVEGEVRDQQTVSGAIKRLWSEGGFARRDVVLGISSQRSMVRQVEMPRMNSAELRSALRYEMGGLLPIPVEQSVFDFVELGPGKPKDGGAETTQVLLVVAQREIVMDHIEVVRRAGLKVRAVDSSPLALLRAYPTDDEDLEAIVSLGAQLVVVAVRQGNTPRFIRTVTRGEQ